MVYNEYHHKQRCNNFQTSKCMEDVTPQLLLYLLMQVWTRSTGNLPHLHCQKVASALEEKFVTARNTLMNARKENIQISLITTSSSVEQMETAQ